MSVLRNLIAFLQTCPLLQVQETGDPYKLHVDYLREEPTSYELQLVPNVPYVKQYVDGGGVKQLLFIFRSYEYYDGRGVETNVSNIAFYEELSDWLEQTRPTIKNLLRAEALTGGYMFEQSKGMDVAIYQMQCRLLYVYYPNERTET